MMIGKFILWTSALVLVGYGLVGLVSPHIPAGFAGLEIGTGDAFAEVGAMYGGLQTGLGLFCALAALRSEYYQAGLILLVLAIGSLALARFISQLVSIDPVTAYTYGAIMYEVATAIIAAAALWNIGQTKKA
ncbi:MAG: DUF4345 family protein [Arenicella sp.]|jgi:hypothetical protein|nr:DUF4345 family protein [Arenicella sp.]